MDLPSNSSQSAHVMFAELLDEEDEHGLAGFSADQLKYFPGFNKYMK